MQKSTSLMVLLILFGIAMVAIPSAYSYYCTVQIDNVDFPGSVSPSQSFQVNTHVTASCPAQLSEPTSVRVDVVDVASNMALSTDIFATGYSFAHGPASTGGTVTSTLNAPSLAWSWPLVVEALFYQQLDLMSAAQQPITIQIGTPQLPESLTTIPILRNGGFENGTADWQSTQGSSGYDSITTSVVHSGSRALATTLISPPPGSNLLAPTVVGVFQTASVSELRGITIDAWYVTQILTEQAAARVRVTVNGLTLNYYVRFGPLTQGTSGDTAKSKSVFLSNWNCISWCEVSRDVGSDFRTMFSPTTLSSVFGSGTATATIALELLGYGVLPTSQFIFWDDVQFSAQVPAATNSLTTVVIGQTSTTALTTSHIITSASQETGEQSQTATETATTPVTQNTPFGFSNTSAFLVVIAAAILIVAAVGFMLTRRKTTESVKPESKARKQFCTNCGSGFPQNAGFCPQCGSRQR